MRSNRKYSIRWPTIPWNTNPQEIVFQINYPGGDMPNYSLNFSRRSSSVVLQYFNLLRLGHDGYTEIVGNVLENVRASDPRSTDLSVRSHRLRERGGIAPAYTLPRDAPAITVLRMVVKENFSRDLVDMLTHDLHAALQGVGKRQSASPRRPRRRSHC